jgi:hypothetical protein
MEHQLWKSILAELRPLCEKHFDPRQRFSIVEILQVWFWAVVHDRPISWAVQRRHWPPSLHHVPLPSNSTMCRRLRSRRLQQVMNLASKRVLRSDEPSLVWKIDGKPLVIGNASQDRQAGYGPGVSGQAKGYKLHLILGTSGQIPDWRVAPMNKDERVMAERMISQSTLQGYLTGDGQYDTTTLHRLCDSQGSLQLVSPRRKNYRGRPVSKRHSPPGRLRSIELLEGPGVFGLKLLHSRSDIERYFGRLSSCHAGLNYLPPWVRGHRRVHRWVQAKLMLLMKRPLAA